MIRKNIVANLIGSGWVALMSFAFIPFYIHFMGIESYGLVGFYMTLQAVLFLLDLGLTATVSRELARLSIDADSAGRMRTLVRTLEIVYLGISGVIFVAAVVLSGWVADTWIHAETLSTSQVEDAVMLMGFVIAARMPFGFYSGGLTGLQRQVLMNIVRAAVETFRNGGAVLVLWLVSSDIVTFFLWQAVVSIVGTYVMAVVLWKNIPESPFKPVFSKNVLQQLWRFAAGMSGIVLVSILLMQMDKIVLSRMLPLEVFGYYTLAGVVAMSLYFIINPIVTAFAPKLTQLVASGNQSELVFRYHQGCQFMSVMIFPVAITIALFSFEILLLWTQSQSIAEHSYQVLSILVLGTLLNGVMNFPYALQIAHAWTKLTFWLNVAMLFLLFPLLIVLTRQFGIAGAASVWLILNATYVLVGIHLMHHRLLPSEKWRWYFQDICLPFSAALLVAVVGRMLIVDTTASVWMFVSVLLILILSFFAAVMSAPLAREKVFATIKQRRLL
ncbi:MAG: oligosaccharide flippase family protein [Mariprofundaceae bacterium]